MNEQRPPTKSLRYSSLKQFFYREGEKKPSPLAKLFYEAFVEGITVISQKECSKRKLISGTENGEFAIWRNRMANRGYLIYDQARGGYRAGRVLIDKINKLKFSDQEVATVTQLTNSIKQSEERTNEKLNEFVSKSEFDQLAKRLDAFEAMVKYWIEINDEPWTKDKQSKYSSNPLSMVKTATL